MGGKHRSLLNVLSDMNDGPSNYPTSNYHGLSRSQIGPISQRPPYNIQNLDETSMMTSPEHNRSVIAGDYGVGTGNQANYQSAI